MNNCLMITTKDQRQFFTYLKNYNQLLEFSKVFNAEISVVKTKNAEILELADLAPALCDKNYKSIANYEVVKIKLEQRNRHRKQILLNAEKIRSHIESQFKRGNIISLRDLRNKYKNHNLTAACLCNHIRIVKSNLEQNGHKIVRIGHGKYKMA